MYTWRLFPSFFSKLSFYQIRHVVSGVDFYNFNSVFLPIVFGKRNGIIFFRLSYASWSLKVSFFFLTEMISRRGFFFYVSDFSTYRWMDYLKNFSLLNQLAISFWRWPPGLFTNFKMYSKLFFSRGLWFKLNNEVFFSFNPRRLPHLVFLPKLNFSFWPYEECNILRIPLMAISDGSFFKYCVLFLMVGNCSYVECVVFYIKFLLLATIKGILLELSFFVKLSQISLLRNQIYFLNFFFLELMVALIKKYRLIKRYDQDFWGDFFVKGFKKKWCEDTQKFKIYFKNVKYIQNRFVKRLLEKSENRVLRKQISKSLFKKIMKNKRTFFFRVDIVKLYPKRKKRSLFAIRLRDRHKIRKFASKINVHQFKHYLIKAKKSRNFIKKFFSIFEGRLDIILYRVGLSLFPGKTRQLISHGNFLVNNKVSNSSSHRVKILDVVSVVNRSFFFRFLKYRLLVILKSFFDRYVIRDKRFRDQAKIELGRYRMGLSKRVKRIRRKRLKKLGNFFFSVPSYFEVNYKIMSFVLINSPRGFSEVFYPYGFSSDRHLLLNTF